MNKKDKEFFAREERQISSLEEAERKEIEAGMRCRKCGVKIKSDEEGLCGDCIKGC